MDEASCWRKGKLRVRNELPRNQIEDDNGAGSDAGSDSDGHADRSDIPAIVDGDSRADTADHADIERADDVGLFGGYVVGDDVGSAGVAEDGFGV